MSYEDTAIRLGLACLFGLIIGAERQARHKVAGLRTHILVSLGSCLIMILSIQIADSIPGKNGDPGRMAAQVVSGIGFLGAGAILKEGVSVIGLTTAASLWLIAAIGLATGAGAFFSAALATAFGCVTLIFIGRFDQFKLRRRNTIVTLTVESCWEKPPINALNTLLNKWHAQIEDITVMDTESGYSLLSISFDDEKQQICLPDLMEEIQQVPGVAKVEKK